VSSINITLYPLARFLSKIISDNIPRTVNQIKNSYELYNALSNMFIPDNYILASFDVVSFFTNVPLDLASSTRIKKDEFLWRSIFRSHVYFTFNTKIYKQTFETPMRSPLSPIIADLIIRDLKKKIF